MRHYSIALWSSRGASYSPLPGGEGKYQTTGIMPNELTTMEITTVMVEINPVPYSGGNDWNTEAAEGSERHKGERVLVSSLFCQD